VSCVCLTCVVCIFDVCRVYVTCVWYVSLMCDVCIIHVCRIYVTCFSYLAGTRERSRSQYTATHCLAGTRERSAIYTCGKLVRASARAYQRGSVLQCIAKHCNTLQYTATHWYARAFLVPRWYARAHDRSTHNGPLWTMTHNGP